MIQKDISDALGLGSAASVAAATYAFFFWLDRNASAQSTRTLSGWLKGQYQRRIDIRLAIIAAFDRLYTYPLFRIKAFLRSAVFSIIVSCVYNTYLFISTLGLKDVDSAVDLPLHFKILIAIAVFVFIILSDYISLFVVRRFLLLSGRRLILVLLLSILVGGLVITSCFILMVITELILIGIYQNVPGLVYIFAIPIGIYQALISGNELIMTPAFLVHLWLPLLALGALGVRLLYAIFRAVEWAQWFLKQGNQHPLRAIGLVAAALVFAGTVVWRGATAV